MNPQYSRLTDDQWKVIREFLPMQRKRKHHLRDIFDAILWITRTGTQWRNMESSFPPWRAVYYYFERWSKEGLLIVLNQALIQLERLKKQRSANPSLVIVDSQSVKLAPMIYENRGIDGNKKVNGRKRQVLTDTLGRIWAAKVHPANEHDSPAGVDLLEDMQDCKDRLEKVCGDKAYRGSFARACQKLNLIFEVPKRPQDQKGFVVEAKRWVVERTFAWLNFYRRLVIDYEHTPRSAVNFLYLANISMVISHLSPK